MRQFLYLARSAATSGSAARVSPTETACTQIRSPEGAAG
jgi:hypothetical protein